MRILFISDLHLQPSMPKTAGAFFEFLEKQAPKAQQLYLLGDIFEFWMGDDAPDNPWLLHLIQSLKKLSDAGTALYWIAGNRDFLVGEDFAKRTGMTLLPELHTIQCAGMPVLLAHGDAQCTDDLAYMAFRAHVRSPQVQQQFLALPIPERIKMLEAFRQQSQQANTMKADAFMDLNTELVSHLLDTSGASLFIHGHTHRPGKYPDAANPARQRYVLSDWDFDTGLPRGGWLELDETTRQLQEYRFNPQKGHMEMLASLTL